jgi:phosphoribosylanthranilate isomerase
VTLWIKICGLTSELGIDAAVRAGADAVGFVFAPSKRQVGAARAAELGRKIPAHIMRVAVMQHPTQELLDEVWRVFRPDVLQTDWEDLSALNLPVHLAVMPVVRAGREIAAAVPARLLLEGPVSGAGCTTDWSLAALLARRTELVLAGGLNPANVGAAITRVRPFGVDVSSGVESAPGQKDAALIEQFISNARAAA